MEFNTSNYDIIFEREAEFYTSNIETWERAASAWNGGRRYIKQTLKKHPSETKDEYDARVDSSYNINLIKYSTERFGDYIFSKPPRRENANLAAVLDFDRKRAHIDTVMRNIFDYHTVFSLVWVFVDMPELNGNVVDLRTKRIEKIRPYGRAVSPMSVPDWSFDATGELEWIILEEFVVNKSDPFIENEVIQRRTLYTKTYWQRFERRIERPLARDSDYSITPYPPVINKLGKVPVIPYTTMLPEGIITVPPIDDILTIHDAVLAGESELLTNILKQTYGQLVLPASARGIVNRIKAELVRGDSTLDLNSLDMEQIVATELNLILSRSKAIIEGEDEKGIARYIQPTGATIESIITHDDRLMSIMMRLYGFLVGVHTTQRESAESKSVDNISLASQLRSIATKLQELEIRMWQMMNGFDNTFTVPEIAYNTDFDIHELQAIIAAMVELVNLNCGGEYNKQLKRTAVKVLDSIHHIQDDDFEKIQKEISSDKKAEDSIKFEDNAKHKTQKSGSKPDFIDSRTDHHKSKRAVGKTVNIQ